MPLRKYQEAVVASAKDSSLVLALTGSGKSHIAQAIAKRENKRALVLTAASVVPQMKTYFQYSLVMSYHKFMQESTLRDLVYPYIKDREVVLILDECSILKNTSNKISKILLKMAHRFHKIFLFSACCAPNSLLEYFMPSFLTNKALGDNSFRFLTKYSELVRGNERLPNLPSMRKIYLARGFKQEVINESDLLKKIATFTIQVPDSEVLTQMPPQTFNQRYFDLSQKQLTVYAKALADSILLLKDSEVPLQSKLVVLGKLQQIETGFAYDEFGDAEVLSDTKFQCLWSLLEEIGPKRVIIFVKYIYEKEHITHHLGATNDPEEFKTGTAQYLVGHPKSIGVGVSLEIAHNIVFFSNSFSYEDRLQSMGRTYRITQKHPCIYFDLLPNQKTISHHILTVLSGKQSQFELVKGVLSG